MTTTIIYHCDEDDCTAETNSSSSPGWLAASLSSHTPEGNFQARYLNYCPAHSGKRAVAFGFSMEPPAAPPQPSLGPAYDEYEQERMRKPRSPR